MASSVISFRLPTEIYDALVAEKQPGESDGTAAIRLLSERLGFTPRAAGYSETLTLDKAEELIALEVDKRYSNLTNILSDTRNQLEELQKEVAALKAPAKKTLTPRTSSGRKLTKDSTKKA